MQVAQVIEEQQAEIQMNGGRYILLYDGVCVMCNDGLQFITKNDRQDLFRFAPVQSRFAQELLTRHGRNAADLDTLYIIIDYGMPRERLLWKHKAATFILSQLGGQFWLVSKLMGLVPTALGDWRYDRNARTRYERFGKYDACPIPPPEVRRKLLTLT